VESADLVVEAIIESMKVKRDLFGFLDGKAK
jgi:3-hydroxyacyl-CoA dehydrogenase